MTKAFNNPKHNTLHLQFPNGNFISTIWGVGSYTENYEAPEGYHTFMDSDDVEIMVTCSDELFKKLQKRFKTTNTVFGHLSMRQWLRVVNEVSND